MAKRLNQDDIGVDDLNEFLKDQSDFAFELRVLKTLRDLGFECQHGGTYEDTHTSKLRQFDLRASMKLGYAKLYLAVECKHIGASFPLLVLRVPRRREESFHDMLLTVDRKRKRLRDSVAIPAMETRGEAIRVMNGKSLYRPDEPVGKSCAQVGRDANRITGTDSEVFTKWSQAISSAHGVIDDAFHAVPTDREGWWLSIILPVVVVPDDRLWVVDYSDDGNMVSAPTRTERCSYYIATECDAGDKLVGVQYALSHLEFVTISGLRGFVNQFRSKQHSPNALVFPTQDAERLME